MTRLRAILPLCLAVGALLSACESGIAGPGRARGNAEDILVVTDSATWEGPVGEAIRAELARPIRTLPGNQGAFRLLFQPLQPRLFDQVKLQPNLVFAAPIGASGPIGDFIRARVGEGNVAAIRQGRATGFNLREDLWARDQRVVIATAGSDSALARAFRDRGQELRDSFNELARERTASEMFSRLRQEDLEQELLDAHGFRVQIQHDYVKVQDTTVTAAGRPGAFVRYRRVLSDTWRDFFVFKQEGVGTLPSEAELDRLTNALLEAFARGSLDSSYVQMDDQRPVEVDTVEIGGRPALETRGFWYMTNDVMGGAYIRHALVDREANVLYVYYGMTFAPDRTLDRRKFLRQMEAIGHTLRTRADLARDAPPS